VHETFAKRCSLEKPEVALLLFAWKGAQQELGTPRALSFFARLVIRASGKKVPGHSNADDLMEYLCQNVPLVTRKSKPDGLLAPTAESRLKVTQLSRKRTTEPWKRLLSGFLQGKNRQGLSDRLPRQLNGNGIGLKSSQGIEHGLR
jgi:hypothetical protein